MIAIDFLNLAVFFQRGWRHLEAGATDAESSSSWLVCNDKNFRN
jgi:hypothetical protein